MRGAGGQSPERGADTPPSADGEARTRLTVELSQAPYTKFAAHTATLGYEWREFYVRFESAIDLKPGEAAARFRLGYAVQTVEIRHYGKKMRLADLPAPALTYGGREPDAPWRRPSEADEPMGTVATLPRQNSSLIGVPSVRAMGRPSVD